MTLPGLSRSLIRDRTWNFFMDAIVFAGLFATGYAIVAVSSLSFIGVGAQPPTPEWGLILAGARLNVTSSWSYVVFPGLVIMLATTGFALLGDGLGGGLGGGSRRRRPAAKAATTDVKAG